MNSNFEFTRGEEPEAVTKFMKVVEDFKEQADSVQEDGNKTTYSIKTATLNEREGEFTSDAIIKGVGHVKYSLENGLAEINETLLDSMEKRLATPRDASTDNNSSFDP